MAGHLLAAGHRLAVHARSKVPEAVSGAGARQCASASEVARLSDIIITMVPDTPDVGAVLFDPGGIAEGLTPGKVVVDITNPLDFQTFDSLVVPADGSAAAELAAKLPQAKVVKAFNTNFAATLGTGKVGQNTTTVLVALVTLPTVAA